jgi:hypothetical protein
VAEEIIFNEDQLADTNVFQTFRFDGVLGTTDIEIFEFTFRLPPPEAYKTAANVCSNLAPENGDAEMDALSPFPYKTNSDYYANLLVVQEQDEDDLTNHYFQITGRESHKTWWGLGLQWDFGVGCMQTNSQFR